MDINNTSVKEIENIIKREKVKLKDIFIMTYNKKGDYKKAKKMLKEIQENNEYILEYLKQKIKFTKAKIDNIEDKGTYSWGSEAEAYFVVKDYKYLLETVPTFIEFIEREIK